MSATDTLARGRTSTITIAVAMAIVLVVPVAALFSSGAVDRILAGIRGQAPVERFDTLQDAPAGTGPSWLPAQTSGISVRTEAPSGQETAGGTRIDGQLPAGWSVPADCKRNTYVQPWDGGGDWPLSPDTRILSCLDGETEWNVFTQGSHIYLFREALRP